MARKRSATTERGPPAVKRAKDRMLVEGDDGDSGSSGSSTRGALPKQQHLDRVDGTAAEQLRRALGRQFNTAQTVRRSCVPRVRECHRIGSLTCLERAQERVVSRIAKCVDDTVALWHQNNQPKFTEFYLDCVKRCIACSNEAVAALLCKFVAKSAAAVSKEQRGVAAAASAVERETLADLVASKLLELVDSRSNVVRQHCCHVLMQLVLELPPEIELEYVHTSLSLSRALVSGQNTLD